MLLHKGELGRLGRTDADFFFADAHRAQLLREATGEVFDRDHAHVFARRQTLGPAILQAPVKDVAATNLVVEDPLAAGPIDFDVHLHHGRRRRDAHAVCGRAGRDGQRG